MAFEDGLRLENNSNGLILEKAFVLIDWDRVEDFKSPKQKHAISQCVLQLEFDAY